RATAVLMAIYTLYLGAFVLGQQPLGYAQWRALFEPQWMRFFSVVFALSLLLHAWVGVRDVLMDYIRTTGTRLVLQVLVIAFLLVYFTWTIQILWSL
ncbi:MAG: succinate dehydrogenase, hydrophobic membrane anchor protein, partial [Burkholderiales bacterium]